jgi:pilus assembly protein FimV
MAVKRDKVLKDAEKLVQKGKLDQAIREYEKILKRYPNDTTIINRVGDLYGRIGQLQRSIQLYEEIADHFTKDGFVTKAIAILKKIQRLDPQRLDIFERLAALYVDQHLLVEAKREYQILADWYVKNGQLEKAIEAQEKLVDLDLGNHVSSLRLAELLIRRGEIGSALKVYDKLGSFLIEKGKLDEAERLYRTLIGQKTEGGEFLAKICDAFLDAGRTAVALEFLNIAIERSPDSIELKTLLAQTHLTMGKTENAVALAKEVLAAEPTNRKIRAIMGNALRDAGVPDVTREFDLPAVNEMLDRSDHAGAQAALKTLLEKSPDDQEVLRLAVRAWTPSSDQETLFTLRAALAESYFNTGELEAAKRLFVDLLDTEPENQRFRERLAALDHVNEDFFRDAGAGRPPVIETSEDVEVIEFEDSEVEVVDETVDEEYVPLARVEPDLEPVTPLEMVEPAAPVAATPKPPAAVTARQHAAASTPEGFDLKERLAEAGVFAKYGLVDKAISHLEDVVLFCPDEIEPRRRLAQLYAEHGDRDAAIAMATPVVEYHRESGTLDDLAGLMAALPELEDALPRADGAPPLRADDSPTVSGRLGGDEQPAGFDFNEEDSDLIEVVDIEEEVEVATVEEVEPQIEEVAIDFDREPASAAVAEQPPSVEVKPTEVSFAEPAPVAQTTPPAVEEVVADELVEISDSFIGPSMGDLEQIDFFIDQELYEDAARVLTNLEEEHPDDPAVASRRLKLKEVGVLLEAVETVEEGAEELFADEEQYIDLAKELEAELAAEEAMVDEATGRGKGEALLEEVFREFQKGVAEQLSEEDSDTHFNLGIAYREMGLLPEAIREFQVASRDPAYFVESCSIIGVCYQEQGMWSEAVSWFQKALVAPDITDDARLGLRYDLAVAYEGAGDVDQAVGLLEEISMSAATYRDVADRLANLSQQRQVN